MKSLAARATMPKDDVRSFLKQDHDQFKDLLGKLNKATRASRRMALLEQLSIDLTAHSRAEEHAVYDPMLKAQSADSRDLANEGYVEHGIVDQLLAELASGQPRMARWAAKAQVLKELLEHHIDEEQTDIFAELGEHFSADELAEMGVAFLRAKAEILESTAAQRKGTPAASARHSRKRSVSKKRATRAPRPGVRKAAAKKSSGARRRR